MSAASAIKRVSFIVIYSFIDFLTYRLSKLMSSDLTVIVKLINAPVRPVLDSIGISGLYN
jgi:hypothetical protein